MNPVIDWLCVAIGIVALLLFFRGTPTSIAVAIILSTIAMVLYGLNTDDKPKRK